MGEWMTITALALFGLFTFGPPVLPPDTRDVPPAEDPQPTEQPDAPSGEAPSEPPVEQPVEAPTEQPTEAPSEPAPEDAPIDVQPPEEPVEDVPVDDAVVEEGGAAGDATAGGAAAGGAAASTPVQRPGGGAVQQPKSTPPATAPTAPTTQSTTPAPTEGPAPAPEPEPKQDPEDAQDEKKPKNLGGFRLFRIGLAANVGYLSGTSQKNGLFDRNKSIMDSINNQDPTISGAGDLGKYKYGGPDFGFTVDAEVVGINVWLDFHKFMLTQGGNFSLLLGYDHEFGFGKRLRLDVGVGGGMHKAFLGSVLSGFYYDKDNPLATNIGTLGVEGRGMVNFHIKIVGPLFTGPYALLGYHYLWSANAAEVTAEKGLHYAVGWSLRLDFAAPKLLGRGKK
jgi:hypothetical protein